MEFFLEMLLTVVVALLLSFPVAKLVSVATAGNVDDEDGNDNTSDQVLNPEIGVRDELVKEEVRFSKKMDGRLLQSEMNIHVVDASVVSIYRFGNEAADQDNQIQETATRNGDILCRDQELEVLTTEAESTPAVLPENVMAEEKTVCGAEEINVVSNSEETMIRGQEERSQATEITIFHLEKEESGEPEEVRVEQSNTNTMLESVNKTEENTDEEEEDDDDDWEGVERSELEKAFVVAAKFLQESGKGEEMSGEVKMELYGLHKIATEGSCREGQPMAIMVSARAKWNAWQKLRNMSQEEAMEKYLTLISKQIPGFMNPGHTVGKMPEMETSILLPPNSVPVTEHPATSETVESGKDGK